VIPCWWMHS